MANPVNPTYLSPIYDLGRAALRRVQWTGLSTPDLDALVRARLVVYALDEDGTVLGSRDVAQPNAWAGLDGLPAARRLRYAIEWHRAPLAPSPMPPLADSPVVEGVRFTLQRAGVSPAWTAWSLR